MRCDEVREDLVAYLDGELAPEERERVDSHLAQCPDCRRERDGLGSTGDLLEMLGARTAGGPDLPATAGGDAPDLAGRVLREARSEEPWCRHIRRQLVAFLDGELTDAESRPVREHLDECEGCRAEAEGHSRCRAALDLWTVPPTGVDLVPRLLPGFSEKRRRRLGLLPLAAAAVLLLAVGLGAAFGLFAGGPPDRAKLPPVEVLRSIDLLDAETLELLGQDEELLELAEQLDWLESVSEEELAMLTGSEG
jgi:anti-sigma factor RsiW